MGKHIQLTIADPCHENWDKMSKSEQGKFCGSCQKQVIDFTGMTDTQLVSFFKKKATETVCGRFYDDQLDKAIPIPSRRIPWVRYFFQFTLPLFLTTLKAKSQGQVRVRTTQTEICNKTNIYGNVMRMENPDDIMDLVVDQGIQIKGTVVNEEGKPVPYASIEKGLVGAAADSMGAFSLILASNPKGIKLKISSVGYESREIELTKKQISGKEVICITLKQAGEMKPVTVIGYGTTKGMVVSSLSIRREYFKRTAPLENTPLFKIFSNPSKAGSNISIDPGQCGSGLYDIQLLNLSGQLIKQQQTRIEKGMGAIPFQIPVISSGTYLFVLVNKKTGKKASEKLIVQ
jgi:hypothetical protein